MEAGRDLDELVVKKVLQWEECPSYFKPSTDIEDAFRIIQHFSGDSDVHLSCYFEGGFYCKIMPDAARADANGKTAPHAICLAALRRIQWVPND